MLGDLSGDLRWASIDLPPASHQGGRKAVPPNLNQRAAALMPVKRFEEGSDSHGISPRVFTLEKSAQITFPITLGRSRTPSEIPQH